MIDRAALRIAGQIDFMCDHALGKQRVERFDCRFRQMPRDVHGTGKKSRIEQVQDRVFDAADILVNIHPIVSVVLCRRGFGPWCGKACKIPRAVDKSVHRIGFAPGRFATGRAARIAPCRMPVQRIARRVKGHVIGQNDRQVFFLLGNNTAVRAMHHRDGTAPIALAAQPPVAQPIFGLPFAETMRLEIVDCCVDGLLACYLGDSGKMVDKADFFGLCRHEGHGAHFGFVAKRIECVLHGQIVFARKVEIALIMRRASEHRAGAILHQDKVADPDGQFGVRIDRVFDPQTRIDTLFFGLFHGRLGGVHFAAFVNKGRKIGVVSLERPGDGVIG